ncbi:methionine biosynthesis protein MetW [Tessaracoccus sp. OS52]|uniref:methionine biosynthesis protein MetW n=1 Tax=Tessaracoccus sp. OS52 TaxID=2886691 RepID=UPI001D12C271|nr:methionine biosynthesis protein MetW [Tessaracoccus sp. OS52]MCC2592910.1 methionine biosynthesis protein MetW [Tessaracoccus sp. OS52]
MTVELRPDLQLIARLIPERSRVLDLGCGAGELLKLLEGKGCNGTGVEMEPGQLISAIRAGVNVIELDLNTQLSEFADDSYDVVVLSRTLQNVHKPREVLRQISRIAVHSVVSMPNFAHWRNRARLLRGRMPMSRDLPFEWYDTPNLHYTSLADLEPLFRSLDLKVDRRIPLDEHGNPHKLGWLGANAFASSAVYLLHAPR